MSSCTCFGVSTIVLPMTVLPRSGEVIPSPHRSRLLAAPVVQGLRLLERSTLKKEFLRTEVFGRTFMPQRQGGRRISLRASSYTRTPRSQPESVPVWLWLVTSLLSAGKSAFQFLCEQPMQLRHIEWPTVNTVVRMAVLTFTVVTCLIVLLATVDSTMSYVLSSLLRRVP
ncbi:hypothetical protein R1flu_001176 [Riccia fluitans]|uniref:Preprotein translocase subunit SecE n=1 Tax=Riccia fluitans TaxID=41844 RepID=A0ABD1Y2W2_9MARC